MFEAFSSAGSELVYREAVDILLRPCSNFQAPSSSSMGFFFTVSFQAHINTHTGFSTRVTFAKRPLHGHLRRRSCYRSVANKDDRQADFLANDVQKNIKGSPDNTSINEDGHRLKFMMTWLGGQAGTMKTQLRLTRWSAENSSVHCLLFVCCFMCATVTLLWGCF